MPDAVGLHHIKGSVNGRSATPLSLDTDADANTAMIFDVTNRSSYGPIFARGGPTADWVLIRPMRTVGVIVPKDAADTQLYLAADQVAQRHVGHPDAADNVEAAYLAEVSAKQIAAV